MKIGIKKKIRTVSAEDELSHIIFAVQLRKPVRVYIAVWRSQSSRHAHDVEIIGAEPITATNDY